LIPWVLAFANMSRTFKRVPTELLPSFLELCRRYLRRFFDQTLSIQERIKAIKLYIRLPKDMLRIDRGGHRSRGRSFRSASMVIQNRFEKLQGDPSEECIPAPKQHSKMRKEEEQQKEAAIGHRLGLIKQGFVGRTPRSLDNRGGIGDVSNPDTWRELQDKHPRHKMDERAIDALQTKHHQFAVLVDKKLSEALKGVDNGSAAGYDGCTGTILNQICEDKELRGLHAKLFSMLANGDGKRPVMNLFLSSRMTPLIKERAHFDKIKKTNAKRGMYRR